MTNVTADELAVANFTTEGRVKPPLNMLYVEVPPGMENEIYDSYNNVAEILGMTYEINKIPILLIEEVLNKLSSGEGDLFLSYITYNPDVPQFGYSHPVSFFTFHIVSVVKIEGSKGLLHGFLSIERDVGILVLIFVLFYCSLSYVMETLHLYLRKNLYLTEESENSHTFCDYLWNFVKSALNEGNSIRFRTLCNRLSVSLYFLAIVFLTNAFTSLITTEMIVQPAQDLIETTEDILNKPNLCPIFSDAYVLNYYLYAESEERKALWRRAQECGTDNITHNPLENLPERLIERKHVFLTNSFFAQVAAGMLCAELDSSMGVHISPTFTMTYGSICLNANGSRDVNEDLTLRIERLTDGGFFQKWLQTDISQYKRCLIGTSEVEISEMKPITFEDLTALLYIFISGVLAIAGTAFVLELLYNCLKTRRDQILPRP